MKSEIIRNINQAFLQLEFSIKLLNHMKHEKIDKDKFDTDLVINGKKQNILFNHSAFNTYNDLILASGNCVLITVGFTSIVLDTSLQSIGKKSNPKDRSQEGMLRSLIYMIRCAYAHDMMHPKWEVRGDYAQPIQIQLRNKTLKLDLSKKHGYSFNIEDIGGYMAYFGIKDLICQIISSP